MTKRYSDINQHDALYKVARAYPGGIEALSQRMGITAAVMYNKLRPGVATHYTSFEEVSEIIELCQIAQVNDATLPLTAMNWRHGLITFPIPASTSISDEVLGQTVSTVLKEFSDVAVSVSEAINNDGKIDKSELETIEKHFQEVLSAMAEWRSRIRLRSEKDCHESKKS